MGDNESVSEKRETKRAVKSRKKIIGYVLFAVLNLAVVVYIALREFKSPEEISFEWVSFATLKGLVPAVACFVVALLAETLKYDAMTHATEGRHDLIGALECVILGKYYDNITPLGAGGQPFQIIFLKKRGYSDGSSAALPVAGFIFTQIAFILLAVVVFTTNHGIMQDIVPIRISAYVGLAFYLFVPACIVLFSSVPNAFGRVIHASLALLHKLRVVRNCEKTEMSVMRSVVEYTENLKTLQRCPWLYVKLFVCSLLFQTAILSVPYFVLRAFGETVRWWPVFSYVVYIYAAVAFIPTPGNSGAAEGSFYAVFDSFAGESLLPAMLVWRLLVFYNWLLLGLVVIVRNSGGIKKKLWHARKK